MAAMYNGDKEKEIYDMLCKIEDHLDEYLESIKNEDRFMLWVIVGMVVITLAIAILNNDKFLDFLSLL